MTEPTPPYQSVKNPGDTVTKVRVIFVQVTSVDPEVDCEGALFMEAWSSNGHADAGLSYYKVVNSISDSMLQNPNLTRMDWLVDVEYLGVGIECFVSAARVDPRPGIPLSPNDIELAIVTNIEPF